MNQLKEAEKKASLLVQESRKGSLQSFFETMISLTSRINHFVNSNWNVFNLLCLFAHNYLHFPLHDAARVDRMKEAKSEAESIIAAYRAEMEAGYQKKFNMVSIACVTC